MEAITGRIETISRSYNGGWRFAAVIPQGAPAMEKITVVGDLGDLHPGDICSFQGAWKAHAKYGRQFQASQVILEVPRDKQGIREYLDRHFRWVGPVLARKLSQEFGPKLFEIIECEPQRLVTISGITQARAQEIHEEYLKIKADQTHDVWFATHGLTLRMRNRLVDVYGSKAQVIDAIKANPYQLADVVDGIGFKKADVIAMSIGVKKDSGRRLRAGLRWILRDAADGEGHCFLPAEELLGRGMRLMESGRDRVQELLETSIKDGALLDQAGSIYFPDLLQAEQSVAAKLRMLVAAHHGRIMRELTEDVVAEMDPDQRRALELALTSKISIITGGPGVGKSWTVNKIIQALGADCEIELAAPTGKAAKRMIELTGRPARTIHRLLEFCPMGSTAGFARNAEHPLTCDVLILDEVSMIDIRLMASLMAAITEHTQLILVGDVDQLPSVGPGAVLADMINSGVIPTARLRTLHRQAAESHININAQRINRGKHLLVADPGASKADFWFCAEEDAAKIPDLIIKAVQAIPKHWPEFGHESVQVLCPQKKGPVGTLELNNRLRGILNPDGTKLAGTSFLIGDRVIQTKNNYRLRVFNGDIGHVVDVDRDSLYVEFEDLQGLTTVKYPLTDIDDLQLAYSLTIHKSQGSEFPVVIIPVHTTNYIMLRRNLLYTAITRGKKLVVLIGTMQAVNIAIKTLDTNTRFTGLKQLLMEGQSQ